MKDYYKILQIHPEASLEVMNNAYRALVRQYHPDLYHSNRKGPMNEKMQEINEAYQILSNTVTRKEYDRRYQKESASVSNAPAQPTGLDVLKKILFWGIGTYVVVKFLFMPFLSNPVVKLILIVGMLFILIRMYRKPKFPS